MFAQKLSILGTRVTRLIILACALGFYSSQLYASSSTIRYGDFSCDNSLNQADPEVRLYADKNEHEEGINVGVSYTFTLNKKQKENPFCEEARRLIQERFELDIEIRKLELQQLKQNLSNNNSEIDNDW